MIPFERSLVQKYQGRPFVFLGINADADRDEVKQFIASTGINWRSWWDGGDTGGPIAKCCGIRGWPSLFVLDAQGIVRFVNLPGPQLEAAIESLLRETETSR